MSLRALARMPAAASERVSRLLHTVVFRMPSPSNISSSGDALAEANLTAADVAAAAAEAESMGIAAIAIPDLGASRALAAGFGPLSFVGSGYGVMLVLTAMMLNRIHHIVQRPHRPPDSMPHLPTTIYGVLRLQLARWLTSPTMPVRLRIPGLLGLMHAWLLFTVVTLQTARVWPLQVVDKVDNLHLETLVPEQLASVATIAHALATAIDWVGGWAADKKMGDVCWSVFLSVCAGLVFSALANGLDRARRRDVGASFNLFGYSFLLHLYSSPLTHHSPPPATLHGRPDVHALFHLWVGLTELVWLQAIELSPTLRRNQLLPTGVCGALGLVHFVYALATAPLRFPSFTFVTHLIALFLSIIIVITVFLRGLNSLLTVGYIPSPVWDTVLPQGSFPSPEDDAGVALLKLGTECIKATSYSGLRNELASVQLHPARPALKLSATGCDAIDLPPTSPAGGFATRIDDIGVTELTNPNDKSLYTEELANLRRALFSLVSDVFTYALVHTPVGRWVYRAAWRAYHARWWYGPRSWRIWRRAAWSAPRRHVARDPPALTAPLQQAPRLRRGIPIAYPHFPTEPRAPEYTYDQVLRGEVELPDDEDDGWESDSGASVGVSVAGSEWGEWEEEVEEDERGTLYTDLVEDGPEGEEGEGDSAAIMLAHLTTRGTLTRRRYAAMLAPSAPAQPTDTVDAFSSAVADRRAELLQTPPTHDEWDEERRRACVVCMVNARDVVLWPCRCLTMCDECRDGLADRLGPGEHTCPSCRTKVDGYSRIYVP